MAPDDAERGSPADPRELAPEDHEALERASRRRVDAEVERLRERHDDVTYREFAVENDRERFVSGYDLVAEGFVGGAGAWVTDAEGRVLVIRHPGHEEWGIPAGGNEPEDDDLADTARREVFEETGIEVELEGLFRLHRKSFYPADEPDRRLHMVEAWFDGRRVGGEIDLDPARWEDDEEIQDARWASTYPDEGLVDVLEDRAEAWDWPGE